MVGKRKHEIKTRKQGYYSQNDRKFNWLVAIDVRKNVGHVEMVTNGQVERSFPFTCVCVCISFSSNITTLFVWCHFSRKL